MNSKEQPPRVALINVVVEDDVYATRINICNSCDHLKKSISLLGVATDRCGLCGCFMSLKAKFVFSKCPINLW